MKYIPPTSMNRILLFLSIILVFITGCQHKTENFELQNAVWIGDAEVLPVNDSLLYGEFPAPLFRKEFIAKPGIKSARLYITAAGYYKAFINGENTGINHLDPAWTNFSKRIYYSEYDITGNVKEGLNCIGAVLGNGFYNPLPMKMWGYLNLRDHLPVGKPVLIGLLKLEYNNGTSEEIVTDKSWKYSYGPILKNNVYLGEVYDAGREIDGWNKPGYDDSQWKDALHKEGPGGKLQKAFFPSVELKRNIAAVNIYSPKEGVYIADMGINFTGIQKIRLTGNPGDTIIFRFGERVYANGELNPMTAVCGQIKKAGTGGPGSPDIAWQTDTYIFGDKTEIFYSPLFSFHTFRYMEISGLKNQPSNSDVEGIAFYTAVENDNSFSCSSDLLNSIEEAVRLTFLNNLISVQSDCPAREKFGYGGDLNAISESYIYNFDMHSIYRKAVYDWLDAMIDSVFIDTAPYVGIKYCGISWESAFLITQYYLYLYYNDIELINELYETNLAWMEKAARLHPSGLVEKGLSDHESMVKVPVELTGTSHYLQCALIMKKFASLMKDRRNEKKFEELSNRLGDIILEKFWRRPVPDPINRQTLFSTLLYHDLIPETEKNIALDSMFSALSAGPSGHFTTGIFGTKYILETLSATGNADSVFKIVNSTSYPGWGFMISQGATTIWETWKESDNVYSNCHPMFGTVSEWFYRWLAGIRPDPDNPGFKKFILAPALPEGLEYVNCTYSSPYGKIISNWKKSGSDRQDFEITIPEGSTGMIRLPVTSQQKISLREKSGNDTFSPERDGASHSTFELGAGEYTVTVIKANNVPM